MSEAICEFCDHNITEHSDTGTHGCSECKCATYSKPGTRAAYEAFKVAMGESVAVTPQEVANRIHSTIARGDEHGGGHSCPCAHLALFYLGVEETTGLFWPDKDGNNVWAR